MSVDRVRTAFAAAGLANLWTGLDARFGLDSGAYFTHPLALPVLQLPCWVGADGVDPTVVAAAQASAVAGYLHARLLDDWMDGDAAHTRTDLLAASFLMALHIEYLVEAGGPGMPALGTARWGAFSRAMLEETHQRTEGRGQTPDTYARSLDRSRAMVLPALAVARHRGGLDHAVCSAVDAIVDAHQRLTDTLDLERDHASGLSTLARTALRLDDGPAAPFQDGRLDAWFAEIEQLHTTAARFEPTMPGIGAWVATRQRLAESVQKRLWMGFLKGWLGG